MKGDAEVCRKCGYADLPNVRYIFSGGLRPLLINGGRVVPSGEHLIVACRGCGYERVEPVINAD